MCEPVELSDDREPDETDDTPRYDYAAMAEAAKLQLNMNLGKKPQQTREAENSKTEMEAGDEPDDTPRYDYVAKAEAAKHWLNFNLGKKPQQTREAENSQTETEAGDVSEPVELIELSDDSEPEEPHNTSRHSVDMESLKQKINISFGS